MIETEQGIYNHKISRREFLQGALCLGAEYLLPPFEKFSQERAIIDSIWQGKINPTLLEIENYATGQIQVRNFNSTTQDWDPEYMPTFAWIHRLSDNPFSFRGLFFIHRSNLLLAEKDRGQIPPNTKMKIYAEFNHETPILEARINFRTVYSANKIDTSTAPLAQLVAESQRTIAIVTCHPPNYKGENPPQRLVYFAWAFLPQTAN